jgi:hypothetical protein
LKRISAALWVCASLGLLLGLGGNGASAATTSSAQLAALGAHQVPVNGSLTLRQSQPCPDTSMTGCYSELTISSSSTPAGKSAGMATAATTYQHYEVVGWNLNNAAGNMAHTELDAQVWWNGSSAGDYWSNYQCSANQPWVTCGSYQKGGFWNGSVSAWNNWSNSTVSYSPPILPGGNYCVWLRIYTQPSGNIWANGGANGC